MIGTYWRVLRSPTRDNPGVTIAIVRCEQDRKVIGEHLGWPTVAPMRLLDGALLAEGAEKPDDVVWFKELPKPPSALARYDGCLNDAIWQGKDLS